MARAGAFVALGREHFDRGLENTPSRILAARVDTRALAGDDLTQLLRLFAATHNLYRMTKNVNRSIYICVLHEFVEAGEPGRSPFDDRPPYSAFTFADLRIGPHLAISAF